MSTAFMERLELRQFLSAAPMVGAGPHGPNPDAVGRGDVIQQRDHDRLRDGSCKTTSTPTAKVASPVTTSGSGTHDRIHLRLRDASCKT